MLGRPHVVSLCGYLTFHFFVPLFKTHTLPTWLPCLVTHWSEWWLSLKMKARLEAGLLFDTARHGCVTAERGEVWGWLPFFDPKLSPVQLASLVAFKITRPPSIPPSRPSSPHVSCPLPSVWPPPPYTPTTFHIRAPINILNRSVHCLQLLQKPYLSSQKQDTDPSLPRKNLTNTHT